MRCRSHCDGLSILKLLLRPFPVCPEKAATYSSTSSLCNCLQNNANLSSWIFYFVEANFEPTKQMMSGALEYYFFNLLICSDRSAFALNARMNFIAKLSWTSWVADRTQSKILQIFFLLFNAIYSFAWRLCLPLGKGVTFKNDFATNPLAADGETSILATLQLPNDWQQPA